LGIVWFSKDATPGLCHGPTIEYHILEIGHNQIKLSACPQVWKPLSRIFGANISLQLHSQRSDECKPASSPSSDFLRKCKLPFSLYCRSAPSSQTDPCLFSVGEDARFVLLQTLEMSHELILLAADSSPTCSRLHAPSSRCYASESDTLESSRPPYVKILANLNASCARC
jgi:hypothetical protein